jgi:predicted lipoprotein with Yx(FWY)xxD motif
MARGLRVAALVLSAQVPVAAAWAQPADIPVPAAKTTEFPAGISVAKVPGGQVYVDAQGRTLYGLDLRTVNRWAVDGSKYCAEAGRCVGWEPLLAPPGSKPNLNLFRGFRRGAGAGAGARPAGAAPAAAGAAAASGAAARPAGAAGAAPTGVDPQQLAAAFGQGGAPAGMYTQQNAPDWTIVDGPAGPQYVYKGYNMVYVRKGDKPRSTAFEGAQDKTWNTLKFIPPVPKVAAPNGVGAAWVNDSYVLTDKDGKLLYTGRCGTDCASWKPLAAGIASQGLGEWTVDRNAARPQWLYRGKPVYVAADDSLASLPRSSMALRP